MSEISRRSLLLGGAGGAAAIALGGTASLAPGAAAEAAPGGHRGGPPTATPADIRFSPGRTLRSGRPGQVGLVGDTVQAMPDHLARYLTTTPENPNHPMYAGAAVIAVKDGVIVQHAAVGDAVRYTLDGTTVVELPADQRIAATTDTIWDLASMSKLFTATSVLQLIEQGRVDLHAPVVTYLPAFASHGKSDITVRNLLTHTSGLIPDPVPSLWKGYQTIPERKAAILDTTPSAPPDTQYVYSDLNFLTLGLIVETISGQSLDEYVREHVTEPLGMHDTMYNPPAALRHRVAAEEYEPWAGRGLVWGQVHDENAWALGGVAGHAGVFSTTHDLAIFAQMYLNGGRYGRARILHEDTVRLMLHDYNGAQFPYDTHGLGWELGLNWYMGALGSPVTFGHTGYTGTSIVVDPLSHSFVILLTNRVHPSRDWGSNNVSRRVAADDVGLALPVHATHHAYYSRTDHSDSTLTLPVPDGATTLRFRVWFDTEPLCDYLTLQASGNGTDFTGLSCQLAGGPWSWTAGDGSVDGYGGRRWLSGTAQVPAGTTALRWQYATDTNSQGRGVYVDDVTVLGRHGVLFDSRRSTDAARISLNGWTRLDD
ncbi:serine hydrolase [Actinocatenispora thailandica]|uniref:Serine hydrolase n=1 Tax=Actinocatenispora thailandica TaxID=227318 RepID=A0A7R7DS38_9ACTN|nr:serine hydrolase [Actinocatenispora thailandica]BCJ36850.1 serine hydrolase [Actinocatenispora thailandica]